MPTGVLFSESCAKPTSAPVSNPAIWSAADQGEVDDNQKGHLDESEKLEEAGDEV